MTGNVGNVIHFTVNNGGINMTIGNPAITFTVASGITQNIIGVAEYSGTTAEMAAKKVVFLAVGVTDVSAWRNTTDNQIYWWNGADWL